MIFLTKPTLPSIDELVRLSRIVKTPEGAALYNKPIGSIISSGPSATDDKEERPMTIVRLRSLHRQLKIAERTGNVTVLDNIREQFSLALKEYSLGKSAVDIISELQT